jgi:hypothetical protein
VQPPDCVHCTGTKTGYCTGIVLESGILSIRIGKKPFPDFWRISFFKNAKKL